MEDYVEMIWEACVYKSKSLFYQYYTPWRICWGIFLSLSHSHDITFSFFSPLFFWFFSILILLMSSMFMTFCIFSFVTVTPIPTRITMWLKCHILITLILNLAKNHGVQGYIYIMYTLFNSNILPSITHQPVHQFTSFFFWTKALANTFQMIPVSYQSNENWLRYSQITWAYGRTYAQCQICTKIGLYLSNRLAKSNKINTIGIVWFNAIFPWEKVLGVRV